MAQDMDDAPRIRLLNNESDMSNHPDAGTDVLVEFKEGGRFIATFYSVEYLQRLLEEHQNSETSESNTYYKILHAVVVNDLHELSPVIDTMLQEGDFQITFRRV